VQASKPKIVKHKKYSYIFWLFLCLKFRSLLQIKILLLKNGQLFFGVSTHPKSSCKYYIQICLLFF
jgi:hypothetical protein